MEHRSAETITCRSCNAELASNAVRCQQCGAAIVGHSAEHTDRGGEEKHRRLIDNRWAILAFLFGAAMVLGLPFLWASRGFSTAGKIVWSVLVTLYTILVFWGFWLVMCWSYSKLAGAFGW